MPVSPQDFAIWSDLTGKPYPQTPAERMALAPEVYQFTRGIGRRGGYGMSPVRKAVDVIGKTALGVGLLAGAAYLGLGTEGFKKLQLDDEADVPSAQPQAANPMGQTAAASRDVTRPTTAENFNQPQVLNQTQVMQDLRGVSPAKPTVVDSEEKPATQSQVITSSQTFSPGTEVEQLTKSEVPHTPVRDRADELIAEFLGGVAAEERKQKQIEKSIDIHNAGIIGKMQPVLKQLHKAGLEEGVTLAGRGEKRVAEAFRETPQYAEMMKSAGASMEPEELIGAPGQPVTFTQVRATPVTRISGAEPAPKESAIVEMVAPKAAAPIEVPAAVSSRQTAESAEAEAFARKALALMPRTQGAALLQTKQPDVIETVQIAPTRVAKEGKITPNEFLSVMSQQQGPLAAYPISPERSKAVTNLTFYPGGEMGVTMMSRKEPKEFVYATSDPYRLAMREYAEEGYPESMGNIGGIAAHQGIAHQMGLQKGVELGGIVSGKRKPAYAGLMSDADIVSAGMGKPSKTRDRAMEVAQRHFETKEMMKALEERAAARRAGLS